MITFSMPLLRLLTNNKNASVVMPSSLRSSFNTFVVSDSGVVNQQTPVRRVASKMLLPLLRLLTLCWLLCLLTNNYTMGQQVGSSGNSQPVVVSSDRQQTDSDTTKGIHWTTGLSWEQILTKAKQENKYIFVDCDATWCRPCKVMDKDVYSNDSVGVPSTGSG